MAGRRKPKKPAVGDELIGVWFQGRRHSARVVHVAQKWMVVVLPYYTKEPMKAYEEIKPGTWARSTNKLDYPQRGKALARITDPKAPRYGVPACRYCDHVYTSAGVYHHHEVDEHLLANHVEQYLDLLSGGDG